MQLNRRLLIESDHLIIDIAESISYQFEAAFGRSFKRLFTATPAKYRRDYKKLGKNRSTVSSTEITGVKISGWLQNSNFIFVCHFIGSIS